MEKRRVRKIRTTALLYQKSARRKLCIANRRLFAKNQREKRDRIRRAYRNNTPNGTLFSVKSAIRPTHNGHDELNNEKKNNEKLRCVLMFPECIVCVGPKLKLHLTGYTSLFGEHFRCVVGNVQVTRVCALTGSEINRVGSNI